MSAEILKAKKQLGEVNMLLKQGKLLAAVANLHEAVGFILKGQLMKHEMQSFTESLDKAAYHLANDRELKKIYPLQISYKPGEERELLASLYALLTFLQENLADEANSHLAALAEYRLKQLELARKLLESDETAKAQQVCGRLIDAAKTDTELKITVADIFLEFGKYDEALEYLKAAYADNPDSAHIFNKLGMALRKSGRLEEAEKFYIQALERQAHDEIIYFNLGRVYLDMKRWKNAIAAADRALAVNAEFVEAKKMKMFATKQLGG
ncbi:Tetratricopeptide repeat-containing protein [Desulfomicrobium norvegicum]|uniref:Tetratricopeptide repeat-containing protein n=1 Tax=Desulfomicrobium norvegicum (strain DSM 1741 / NCIMB 8310) TaxID=52561 RepID=A0A8G2C608_DESNO|nr:tetratricopeptide repeat protein [Desulfomicrobium norvegicum]SFM08316.1 Tetratricopeptide repeat-containing protein [Desulfomicrobium norvegicum]